MALVVDISRHPALTRTVAGTGPFRVPCSSRTVFVHRSSTPALRLRFIP